MDKVKFLINGDTSLTVEFGNEISDEINAQVRALHAVLQEGRVPGIIETVPTYRSLMICYDPGIIPFQALTDELRSILVRLDRSVLPPGEVLELPVLYGGEKGPDIAFVAAHNRITEDEVIRIHTEPEYLIYMLGFTPGFAYLGGMSKKIAAPRLSQPRLRIQAGSVGIAGGQTGIYPLKSPGGWRLIGHTPVVLYNPHTENPILLRAGQYIKFRAVSQEEYDDISASVKAGTYVCRRYKKEAVDR